MFEKRFSSLFGVREHFRKQGVEPVAGVCEGNGDDAPTALYPWPLEGFGLRCAACILRESRNKGA